MCGAAEPLAQPVEVALLGDHEQGGGPLGHLPADGLDLLLGDAQLLGGLAQGADGASGGQAEHRHREERAEQQPPERAPPDSARGVVVPVVAFGFFSPSGQDTTAWSMTLTS